MENKQPYTEEENKINDLLKQAHDLYCKLPEEHPADLPEWVNALHRMQHVLAIRIVRRDYPDHFVTFKPKN